MHPSSYLSSVLPPPMQHGPYSNGTEPGMCWNADAYSAGSILSQDKESQRDVEIKPLDLSLRAPRQDTTWPVRSTMPSTLSSTSSLSSSSSSSSYYKPYTTSRPSRSCSDISSSHRLSPHPFLTTSSGAPRHRGSPCLTPSRSPLMRPLSPYYSYHRQTPSPYYNYLPASCTPPENCTSLQVLSSTNRLLNALSSTPTTHFRSFEDQSGQDEMMCESRPKEDVLERDQEDVDVEVDEPTYIDMDSATTVKSVSSRQRPANLEKASPVYTNTKSQAAMPQIQAGLHHDPAVTGPSSYSQMQQPVSLNLTTAAAAAAATAAVSISHSSSQSTSSASLLPSSRSLPVSPSYPLHVCDSSIPSNPTTADERMYPFYKSDSSATVSDGQASQQVSTTTLTFIQAAAGGLVSDNIPIHPHTHPHPHHPHHQHQHQLHQNLHCQSSDKLVKQQEEESKHQQNPDSSCSPTISDSPSSTGPQTFISPASSTRLEPTANSSGSVSGGCGMVTAPNQSPQLSPDSNVSQASSGSPSVKDNQRSRTDGTGMGVGPTAVTPRRSFFQLDKSLIQEKGGSGLFSEQLQNEESGRLSILDFWISKILMEETPRRRCSADIRQTVDGNRRIRLRLVDLIELQVEQSLKA